LIFDILGRNFPKYASSQIRLSPNQFTLYHLQQFYQVQPLMQHFSQVQQFSQVQPLMQHFYQV